ncbi:dynein regulatory complex subunit 2-like [Megalops cyprinoides]|uniref:dynein regulatory complex subunit 2-like n=1 Tax=Megalops cyprinoides TaxID=118141 RepID=UPI0018649C1E|nr:dynein regulatory complex subunit 2-like [Megalops cyprinoides]
MPKKGKKKKGKKKVAAMTEEERLLFLQQKALEEEELARKRQEMLTQYLKEKLKKEERNSMVNMHKLTEKWRTVFRQACTEELRRDMSVLSQTLERVLDHKDSVIECLVGDLMETEQQWSRALRSQVECADQLMELQRDRLASLRGQWSAEVERLSTEFETERNLIMSQHEKELKYLEEVSFAIDQYYSEVDSEARQDYQGTCDDIKNKTAEEKNTLRVQLEGDVEVLWLQVQQALRSYTEATEGHCVTFETLQASDQRSNQEINSHVKKLQKLQESISVLRCRLCPSNKGQVSTCDLRTVKEEVTLQGQQLKAQLSNTRVRDKSLLSSIIIQSTAAAKKLQGIISKGEKLLRLTEVCRKLEKEREKAFYTITLSDKEQSLMKYLSMEPLSEELAQAILKYSALDSFWQPYNKALMERLCLQREQEKLSQVNRLLRSQLRQYLDGISVSDEVLRQRNPLLMVSRPPYRQRPSETALPPPPRAARAHVVQLTL